MKIQNGLHQCLHFNSRPHGGRPRRCGGRHNRRYFNSRPHGGRHTSKELAPRRMVFQLTPSRRAASLCRKNLSRIPYFNSRPHGGRLEQDKHSIGFLYFNSRPHGGRLSGRSQFPISPSFQLTPSRRATSLHFGSSYSLHISTHALTEGDIFLCIF